MILSLISSVASHDKCFHPTYVNGIMVQHLLNRSSVVCCKEKELLNIVFLLSRKIFNENSVTIFKMIVKYCIVVFFFCSFAVTLLIFQMLIKGTE